MSGIRADGPVCATIAPSRFPMTTPTRLVSLVSSFLLATCGGITAGCVSELGDWGSSSREPLSAAPGDAAVVNEEIAHPPAANPAHNIAPLLPASCSNDVLDGDETGIDCGGSHCLPCTDNWACRENRDCQSNLCFGVCLALTCSNGIVDTVESDLDCGGSCAPCLDGAGCYDGSDCESGVCRSGQCDTPTCEDGVLNGDETDVDCGGTKCAPCPNGKHCATGADCDNGVCVSGLCVTGSCTDGVLNGDEADVDCGGACSPCEADQLCSSSEDCVSGACVAISGGVQRCSEARCDDGIFNGRETDVDCGGPDCAACADGARCSTRIDCESVVCDRATNTCSPSTCTDDVRNGAESDVDCGGDCVTCVEGMRCSNDTDCASGLCLEFQCRAATCTDSRKNGNESDVDCGGGCPGCELGRSCSSGADCRSAECDGVCLPGAAGRPCSVDDECRSGSCVDDVCTRSAAGSSCVSGDECRSGYCSEQQTCTRGGVGTSCLDNDDCASAMCTSNVCAPTRTAIATDGGMDTSVVMFKASIQAHPADPPVQWRDMALLYFFIPEAHDDFVARYYDGPDFAVWDARFLAVSRDEITWAMVWRATSANTKVVPTTFTTLDFQIRNDPWATFNLANDHSYRFGLGNNPKVVVCQRVDGVWVHTQGTPPPTFAAPCELVVDRCSAATAHCDPLLRTN